MISMHQHNSFTVKKRSAPISLFLVYLKRISVGTTHLAHSNNSSVKKSRISAQMKTETDNATTGRYFQVTEERIARSLLSPCHCARPNTLRTHKHPAKPVSKEC